MGRSSPTRLETLADASGYLDGLINRERSPGLRLRAPRSASHPDPARRVGASRRATLRAARRGLEGQGLHLPLRGVDPARARRVRRHVHLPPPRELGRAFSARRSTGGGSSSRRRRRPSATSCRSAAGRAQGEPAELLRRDDGGGLPALRRGPRRSCRHRGRARRSPGLDQRRLARRDLYHEHRARTCGQARGHRGRDRGGEGRHPEARGRHRSRPLAARGRECRSEPRRASRCTHRRSRRELSDPPAPCRDWREDRRRRAVQPFSLCR